MSVFKKSILLLALVLPVILPACHQDKEEDDNKPKQAFVGAPKPSATSEKAADAILYTMQRLVDSQYAKGVAYAVITADGVSVRGLGDYANSQNLGAEYFQIGSISKTFTGLAMASMVNEGLITIDTPLTDCMPKGIDTTGLEDITLGMLATHTSGLPRDYSPNLWEEIPDGNGGVISNITVEQFWQKLSKTKRKKIGKYAYSNYGLSILSHALAICAKEESWETLIAHRVTEPLGVPGINTKSPINIHGLGHNLLPMADTDFNGGGNAPAGALHANLNELARLAQMAMSKEDFQGKDMLLKAFEPITDVGDGSQIGMLWMTGISWIADYIVDKDAIAKIGNVIYHDGNTGSFISFLGFSPDAQIGIAAVCNNDGPVYETAPMALAQLLGENEKVIKALVDDVFPEMFELTADARQRLLGQYQYDDLGPTYNFNIVYRAEDNVILVDDQDGSFTLLPFQENALLYHATNSDVLYFDLPEDGGPAQSGYYYSAGTDQKLTFSRIDGSSDN